MGLHKSCASFVQHCSSYRHTLCYSKCPLERSAQILHELRSAQILHKLRAGLTWVFWACVRELRSVWPAQLLRKLCLSHCWVCSNRARVLCRIVVITDARCSRDVCWFDSHTLCTNLALESAAAIILHKLGIAAIILHKLGIEFCVQEAFRKCLCDMGLRCSVQATY